MQNAYKFHAGLNGSNVVTVGKEPTVYQYGPTELQAAVNATPAGGVLILEQGTYPLTDPLYIYKPITVMCETPYSGTTGCMITSAGATATVFVNVPATSSATFIQNNFKNIIFNNTNAGAVPCMNIDNGNGAALPFYVYFDGCAFYHTGALGINIAHTAVAAGTIEYLNFSKCVLGVVALAHPIAGDQFNCYKCMLSSTITMSAEATASIYSLIDCIYLQAVQTVGGNAAQIGNVAACAYDATPFGGAITASNAAHFTDLGFAGTPHHMVYA